MVPTCCARDTIPEAFLDTWERLGADMLRANCKHQDESSEARKPSISERELLSATQDYSYYARRKQRDDDTANFI
jgi:hypothetical protein